MEFSIAPPVLTIVPDLCVGLVVVRDAHNNNSSPKLTELLRDAEQNLRNILSSDTFKQHPAIECWQKIHKAFGNNPNRNQPSIQALVKRVLNGGTLPNINPLVDCYNVISLRHILPAGGEDIRACVGDIVLTVAEGGEPFVPLGEVDQDPPEAGEIIYRDDVGVLCRRFNWREADRTKITAETSDAILVLEAVGERREMLPLALKELSTLVQEVCGGQSEQFMLSAGKKSVQF